MWSLKRVIHRAVIVEWVAEMWETETLLQDTNFSFTEGLSSGALESDDST